VLAGVRALLKPGGELLFSPMSTPIGAYPGKRCFRDPVLLRCECLSGALTGAEFQQLARRAGSPIRGLVSDRPLAFHGSRR